MPNPTITASSYAGEFAGKYIAASLLTAKTLDDAAITILPNIKYKAAMKVGAFSNLVRSADCDFDSSTSGLTLTEKVLTPTELQVNLQICKKELHADWEAAQMGFSAFDSLPPLFSDFVIARVAAEVASATETSIWQGASGEGNFDGFRTVHKISGSGDSVGLFTNKYFAKEAPFFNFSGSVYLSFLLKSSGSEAYGLTLNNTNVN